MKKQTASKETPLPSYATLKQYILDMEAGDHAKQKVDMQRKLYGPNNIGTNMTIAQGIALGKAIKKGQAAIKALQAVGFLDENGHWINGTNPVLRSLARWWERRSM